VSPVTDLVDPIRAKRKIMLTGTPIVNRPNELHPLIAYLDPARWSNYMTYAKRYCDAHEEQVSRYKRVWIFSGANEANLPELQETLRGSIMIRRLKTDVLTELPRKMRQVIEVPATKEMAGLVKAEQLAYDGDEDAEIDSDEMKVRFEEMARIRHDLAVAKVPFIVEHVKEMMEETDKIVIMAHHHDVQDALIEALGPVAVLHRGGLSEKQKQAAVDRFQNDPEIKVFVGSIKASGVGITLTAAHTVIFAELDWVPGNISQAEDRCHRIGQTDTVWVQHLVVEGSLDATMANRIIEKQRIMDKALDEKRLLPDPEPTKEKKATVAKKETAREQEIGLREDQIAAAHEALQIVAGYDPDRAAVRNGIGFSGTDGEIGHSLAAQDRWSAKQTILGHKLAIKYQRQLPASLVARLKNEAQPEIEEKEEEKVIAKKQKSVKVAWTEAERDELRGMCLKYGPFNGTKEFARVHPERSEAGCMYQWSKMKDTAGTPNPEVPGLKARLRGGR